MRSLLDDSTLRPSHFHFRISESEAHLRKKQRQQERLNSFINKYKATLDKSGTSSGTINGGKLVQPPSKSDVYTFTPQDFKYENKHYKYIKYTKYNKVRERWCGVSCGFVGGNQ